VATRFDNGKLHLQTSVAIGSPFSWPSLSACPRWCLRFWFRHICLPEEETQLKWRARGITRQFVRLEKTAHYNSLNPEVSARVFIWNKGNCHYFLYP